MTLKLALLRKQPSSLGTALLSGCAILHIYLLGYVRIHSQPFYSPSLIAKV